MHLILTSPYTLLLSLVLITIWYFEKAEDLDEITLPSTIKDGMEVHAYDIKIPVKTNSRAAIYYEINGVKKSTIADKEGRAYIYYYFNDEKMNLTIFKDQYQTKVINLTINQKQPIDHVSNFPTKVFENPYKEIAKKTKFTYFVEDDYVLLNVKTEAKEGSEFEEYLDYLISDFNYQLDLIKENTSAYRTILMVNDQIRR